jgi:hypothetical protein
MQNVKNKKEKKDRMYTQHGLKKAQGILSVINGKKALATFEGEKIVGYSTLEEIQEQFYKRELPKYDLNF